jgi:hypothetical protein
MHTRQRPCRHLFRLPYAISQDGYRARAAKDSAEIARLTMIVRDRAYVYHHDVLWLSHLSERTGHYFWGIRPRWINSGNTPTRNLGVRIFYELRDAPLPENFEFSSERGDIPIIIAPHAIVASQFYAISPEDLILIQHRKKFFYIYGTAAYRDIFPGTPERVTKFCVRAIDVTGDPHKAWDQETNPLEIIFRFYHRHNCADDGCDET